jgi:hypothetical protein
LVDCALSTELAVDAGASHVVPTITISDVEEETLDDNKPGEPHVSPPGGLPAGAAPEIPDWYKASKRESTPCSS